MFPDRQLGPHRDWKQEVEYLDNIFKNGAAYTVGKVNGDHWLLYLTNPEERNRPDLPTIPSIIAGDDLFPDFTIEILMSDLATEARLPFLSSISPSNDARDHASALSEKLGITGIFPSHLTTLDAYSFHPCGYSANALIKWGADPSSPSSREGYYTIHVTPEKGWSYASFECNVPSHSSQSTRTVPDLKSLVRRVVAIFKPARLTLTLFISSKGTEAEQGESIESVQRAFKLALADPDLECAYSCVKINYEFGGYDLAFASFELKS